MKALVSKDSDGQRLDVFLVGAFGGEFSRIEVQKQIELGTVLVNGKTVKASYKIKAGNEVVCGDFVRLEDDGEIEPIDMKLKIEFENENLAIINKPAGLTVHAGAGTEETLVNGLKFHFDSLSNERGLERMGIVHRLDKNTSGLMIVAKNNKAHRLLSEMLKEHTIERRYLAVCCGMILPTEGRIENYIEKDKNNLGNMKISKTDNGKIAITNYKIKQNLLNGAFSLVECVLETGRTHQIRVHLASLGYPVVGDMTYAKPIHVQKWRNFEQWKAINRHLLHSHEIKFIEPITGEKIHLKVEVPNEFLI